MAKKKATKSSTAVKKGRHGRPKGAKNIIPQGIEVFTKSGISRKEGVPGLKRITLVTLDPNHALRLERLADLVEKHDRNLFSIITPPSLKQKKKVSKAKT